MISEFRKSINAILYERITSPLYGAFVISWLVWNWRIVYLTFFVSETNLGGFTKIEYIEHFYSDWKFIILYPAISTAIILSGISWLNNWAFWLSLYFEKIRREWKEDSIKSQRLTIEQSMEIRNEIADQNLKFDKQIQEKNKEKKLLSDQIERLTNQITNLDKERNSLRVLVAYFGRAQHHIEVSEKINALITNEATLYFHVDTHTLSPNNDPVPGEFKELLMTYQFLGKYRVLMASEGEIIDFKNGELQIIKGGIARTISDDGFATSFNRDRSQEKSTQ